MRMRNLREAVSRLWSTGRGASALLIAATVASASPARGQEVPRAKETSAHVETRNPRSPSFSLEPGDLVGVEVWREKDLACDCRVDEHGRLTLPLLGTFDVVGRPWDLVRDSLLSRYSTELRNPSVVLTPLRRVQVLGEVTKPGQYWADPTLSLAGLVALAGGASPKGDLRRVRVVRDGRTIVKAASVESLTSRLDFHSNDQVFVGGRPWLEQNGALVASTVLSAAGIMVALIRH